MGGSVENRAASAQTGQDQQKGRAKGWQEGTKRPAHCAASSVSFMMVSSNFLVLITTSGPVWLREQGDAGEKRDGGEAVRVR